MVQFQETVILNKSMIDVNQDQSVKHAFLLYKNQVMMADMSLYGTTDKMKEAYIKSMFEALFFVLSYDTMVMSFDLKNPSKEVLNRLKCIMVLHLEQTTDVLIQILS